MTPSERQALRGAVDKARRRLVKAEAHVYGTCSGCGAEWSSRTLGCYQCSDRHAMRARAKDPVYRAAQAEYERGRRATTSAQQRQRRAEKKALETAREIA